MPPEVADLLNNIGGYLSPILLPAWGFLKDWWWIPLPFILWKPFLFFWHWWRIDIWLATVFEPILLEIKIPKDNLKPIRAMEEVMNSLHSIVYHPPDWWEKWVDGQIQTTIWMEIVSLGGEIHFYVRIHSAYRDAVEAAIYSQFPEAEITQAQDYTKFVPSDIPNKDWDFFGADYVLMRKEDWYPIKTYTTFETETEALEEKRVDPVAALLESLAKIKPEEQIWFQFGVEPTASEQQSTIKWLKDGEALRDKLAKREDKTPQKPIVQEAADLFFAGKIPGQEEEKKVEAFPPEMRLTPGEKDIVMAIEKKMSKSLFITTVRFIYLGRKDVWFKQNFRLAFSYFSQYETMNLNSMFPSARTITKIHKHWFLPWNTFLSRRHYLRRRKLFKNYINRFTPWFPRAGGTFMLNTEEVASLFHFPSWIVSPVPGVSRVEAKKGPAPDLLNK
ncbi:MAG: hypothetical protein ABH813_00650 [Patescibacteria group bacterium]